MPALRRRAATLFALALLSATAPTLRAQATPSHPRADSARARGLDTVHVTGRIDDLIGSARTASEGHVGAAELRARPVTREGELLETVPGVIVTQHSGDGKANQYFVRGFNLDHGTDFQTRLEGMPLNLPTHGHGQGYTDLTFLIPEFVDHIDYALGVYYADVGDFGSAGAADIHLVRSLTHPFADVEAGTNGFARIATGASRSLGDGALLLGGEAKRYDGPWVLPEGVRKLSGLARYSWETGASRFSVLGLAYHDRWRSTDQVPQRAIDAGIIPRFGNLDSTDGGDAERYSVSASWRHLGAHATQQVDLFGAYSDLTLFSDFTYFLDDPVHGDQFSQTDHRVILGGSAAQTQALDALGASHLLTLGLQTRADLITGLGLFHTERRVRLTTVRNDDVNETTGGLYVMLESRWSDRLRSMIGVRGDAFGFDVRSDLAANSGRRTAGILSPKASVIFSPTSDAEFYVSAGLGFHSNDARGTTITVDPPTGEHVLPVDPLVRSRGAEVGLRVTPVAGLRTTASAWLLDLDSELLFTGDAGITEPAAASQRRGITVANFYHPLPSLSLDADVSFARARFVGVEPDMTSIPGALEQVIAAGAAYDPHGIGAYAAVRLRHFGSYPLEESNSVRARGSSLVNAEVGYQLGGGTRLQLSILNLRDERADDIQYAYASRLPGEGPDGIDDVHLHPAEPRQIRMAVDIRF